MTDMTTADEFPIEDTVCAWVPHGRFVVPGHPGGALHDLRFAAKDLFDVAGHPTGAGNPDWLVTHEIALRSSPIVDSLLGAGATLMGKVLTDELAYSLHGDNAHYGAPLNARAPDRVTGGSSSGSAAAAAAGLVDFALGTDTGGSTRVPASYCGLWGLRTTHGLLPTEGLVPLHPSYDTVTWLARDRQVFGRVGQVLLPASPFVPRRILRIDDACALADPPFESPVGLVLAALEALLASSPRTWHASTGSSLAEWRQAYMTTGAFEGWQVHGDWITRLQPRFGAAVQARWQAASRIGAQAVIEARRTAAQIRWHVREQMGDDTVAVLPSAASLAPRRDSDPGAVDEVRLRTMAITCIAGLAGLPQVSLPFADSDGVPLGVSLLGPAGSDLALIGLAQRVSAALSRG